jgi:hypothetical protein
MLKPYINLLLPVALSVLRGTLLDGQLASPALSTSRRIDQFSGIR